MCTAGGRGCVTPRSRAGPCPDSPRVSGDPADFPRTLSPKQRIKSNVHGIPKRVRLSTAL